MLFDNNTYYQSGQYNKGIKLFFQMCSNQVQLDLKAFTTVFTLCGKLQNKDISQKVYSKWAESGIPHSEFSASSAITMFIKCNMLDRARSVSNKLQKIMYC
jgi:hypothetical protein